MPSEREYELKFGIDPRYAERLASHTAMPALMETHRLAATYFDTEDGALRKRGVSLRVRRSGDTVTQTVKRQGSSSIDREEWELEDADTVPDLDWLKSTPLRKLFEKRTVRTGLRPSFTVDVERSVFRLHHEGRRSKAPSTLQQGPHCNAEEPNLSGPIGIRRPICGRRFMQRSNGDCGGLSWIQVGARQLKTFFGVPIVESPYDFRRVQRQIIKLALDRLFRLCSS